MPDENKDEIKQHLVDNYSSIAQEEEATCCPDTDCCETADKNIKEFAQKAGYSRKELEADFNEANLGLSCGNPQAIANLKKGETVIDLGCGAGFDVFLAAREVGKEGKVIGIDMTPEMINKARNIAKNKNFENVEFRLGEIENIPASGGTAEVIISNCVINLSPDKQRVYEEAYRVLKDEGRIAISDVVKKNEFPEEMTANPENYSSCITGAIKAEKMREYLKRAGFADIKIETHERSEEIVSSWKDDFPVSEYIYSARIRAKKQI